MASSVPVQTNPTFPRLRGRTLWGYRLVWFALMASCFVFYINASRQTSSDPLAAFAQLRLNLMMGFVFVLALTLFIIRSDHFMTMFISAGLVLAAGSELFLYGIRTPGTTLFSEVPVGVLAQVLTSLGIMAQILVFGLLPDGRFVPAWSRTMSILWVGLVLVVDAFIPYPDNLPITYAAGTFFVLPALYAQIYRYRHVADVAQRQQIKWILTGLVLAVSGFLFHIVVRPGLLFALPPDTAQVVDTLLLSNVWFLAILAVPVCLSIALTRFGLWDADTVLNRSMVYGLLTAALGLSFVLFALAAQTLLEMLTGTPQPTLVLAVTTVLTAVLFQPLRERIQAFIDARFPNSRLLAKINAPKPVFAGDSLAGQTLGSYQIIERMGRGGMADVYRARHVRDGRDVALKVMLPPASGDPNAAQRFEREARTVAALRHPHIVQLYDYGLQGDERYMVMELLDGSTLDDISYPLALADTVHLIAQIASALDYAHARHIVHRDVKPSNVLLRRGPHDTIEGVLSDFGVARLLEDHVSLTGSGLVGTLDYLAPEQISGAPDIDHRADIYAFGVMVYQMLTGKLPFRGESAAAVLFAHLQNAVPDPRRDNPLVPECAALAVMRALAKDRTDRYDSAGDFAAALSLGQHCETRPGARTPQPVPG